MIDKSEGMISKHQYINKHRIMYEIILVFIINNSKWKLINFIYILEKHNLVLYIKKTN